MVRLDPPPLRVDLVPKIRGEVPAQAAALEAAFRNFGVHPRCPAALGLLPRFVLTPD